MDSTPPTAKRIKTRVVKKEDIWGAGSMEKESK